MASSSSVSTVDLASFGPVSRSATGVRFRHLATVFLLERVALNWFHILSFEELVALFVFEEVVDASDSLPQLIVCSGCGLSDQGFDLGECLLDGVQVAGVRRQGFEGLERRPVDGFPRKTNQAPMSLRIAAAFGFGG